MEGERGWREGTAPLVETCEPYQARKDARYTGRGVRLTRDMAAAIVDGLSIDSLARNNTPHPHQITFELMKDPVLTPSGQVLLDV